jgi:hypothetical protein
LIALMPLLRCRILPLPDAICRHPATPEGGNKVRKTFLTLLAAATLAMAGTAAPKPAEAGSRDAAIFAGVALGIAGVAIAAHHHRKRERYYYSGYGYYPRPVYHHRPVYYARPRYVYVQPACGYERQQFWSRRYHGWVTRTVRVCY